jgi:signal peptidase I
MDFYPMVCGFRRCVRAAIRLFSAEIGYIVQSFAANDQMRYPANRSEEIMRNLFIAVLLIMFFNSSVAGLYNVASESMEDTLLVGDEFVLYQFWYGIRMPFAAKPIVNFSAPKAGDIIVFRSPLNPEEEMVKRCVASVGQSVDIMQKNLYVDDKPSPLPAGAKNTDPPSDPRGKYRCGPTRFLSAHGRSRFRRVRDGGQPGQFARFPHVGDGAAGEHPREGRDRAVEHRPEGEVDRHRPQSSVEAVSAPGEMNTLTPSVPSLSGTERGGSLRFSQETRRRRKKIPLSMA